MKFFNSLDEVTMALDKNYHFAKSLEEMVYEELSDNEKLELISFIGIVYSVLVTGMYSTNSMENEIINIGKKIKFKREREARKKHILHVMTQAFSVGGHTKIVNNWVKWDENNISSIVFTDMMFFEIPSFLKETVKDHGGEIYCLKGNYIDKARELLEISQDYERIVLHMHMHDVVPVLAYSNPKWDIPVYFYNHGDFRLSYGFSISDVVLNMNDFDYCVSKVYRGCENNTILRFPGLVSVGDEIKIDVEQTKKELAKTYGFDDQKKLVVSMGANFKYKNIIGVEFDQFVKELLNRIEEDVYFLIIGADENEKKWKILKEATHGRGKAIGVLSRKNAEALISCADLYVASFPMLADGMSVAKRASVPSVALELLDRKSLLIGEHCAKSIEELISQSIEVLEGNKEKYLNRYCNIGFTKQEWLNDWYNICENNKIHKIRTVKSVRCIEKREYINCQLMQESGVATISANVNRIHSETQINKIKKLDAFYHMGIFDEDIYVPSKMDLYNLSQKYRQLFLESMQWHQLKNQGKNIAEYLLQNGYRTVAIYGLSYLGKNLLEELKNSQVEVRYGIDKNVDNIHVDIKMVTPIDKLESVDLIINTSMASISSIREYMKYRTNIEIISLDRILNLMMLW